MKQQDKIKDALSKEYPCYVLVTCKKPSLEGKMQVEMSYEGDPDLASYLLQGAQSVLDGHEEDEKQVP